MKNEQHELSVQRDIIARKAEMWSNHEVRLVDELFTDDCVYKDLAARTAARGKEQLREFVSTTIAAIPDYRVELTNEIYSPGWAATEWIMSGTQIGDFPRLKATGNTFRVRGASITQFHRGRIHRHSDYYDMITFLKQLGSPTDLNSQ